MNDPVETLQKQVLPDRFEVLSDPLGWQCRFCDAVVRGTGTDEASIGRLAESAADHGLYCGRCDD